MDNLTDLITTNPMPTRAKRQLDALSDNVSNPMYSKKMQKGNTRARGSGRGWGSATRSTQGHGARSQVLDTSVLSLGVTSSSTCSPLELAEIPVIQPSTLLSYMEMPLANSYLSGAIFAHVYADEEHYSCVCFSLR